MPAARWCQNNFEGGNTNLAHKLQKKINKAKQRQNQEKNMKNKKKTQQKHFELQKKKILRKTMTNQ